MREPIEAHPGDVFEYAEAADPHRRLRFTLSPQAACRLRIVGAWPAGTLRKISRGEENPAEKE